MKLSIKYLLAATGYGICGMALGIAMGATQNFALSSVHAHLSLLGWVTLMLYGLTYQTFVTLAETRLAAIQFYIANAGVLSVVISLALLLRGVTGVVPVLLIGELLTLAALVIFFLNIWNYRDL